MNLGSKILTAALLTAAPCLAAAAPAGETATGAAAMPTLQKVDWRGGPRGEWFPDRRAWSGGGAGFALAAPYAYDYGYDYAPAYDYSYDYAPGYPTYAPGYAYEPGYAYSAPGSAPGQDTAYCMQRYRSYDPASGTYLGYDGIRHPCP